ncbi:NAD+ synthase [Terriglobus roseus]|uniref:Glutamine-dependent NAD(+) synthetase n=1 Tax=Terriglobus roseus TaxID=392734 RepID=A0A1G7IVX4_9BACT|nr:NAD+ synthase [Terriglobus roseus]SDF16821.1 NAD+ synthase (glutamine-hydrolysing) [Terriglobus roseus]
MKIALAQLNPTVGDFKGNTARILDYAKRAGELGADLVVYPELAIPGYPPQDLLEDENFLANCQHSLDTIAKATAQPGMPAILCGTALASATNPGKHARNIAALCYDGKVQFIQQKMLLPFYDVFDEQRYFQPAESQSLIEFGGEVLAVTICEDAWNDKDFWPERFYPNDPVERLLTSTLNGRKASLLLNISASPYWEGKQQVRRSMIGAIAKRHSVPAAMSAQVGGNDSLLFDGASFVVNRDGETIAAAKSFQEDLLLFDTALAASPIVAPVVDDVEAAWKALAMGIRDYVRKCGFSKVLIGLSGGIDSAVVAALAVDAVGKENVMGIGMPSEYSSSGSVDDALALAKNLGIQCEIIAIRETFNAMDKALGPLFAETPFGLAEENMQARIRGTLLMSVSNKFGHLVLTTGNKSEMSVGYCTLYGDMVGALAVIGDVWKTKVYQLAHYANREREVIPQNTITKPPSAELRPDQKDTDSLPPYEILDPILQAYVERYESADEIVSSQGVDRERVEQVLRLVERSEYKRQQAAPVLKVTAKSFGTGRRFPLAARTRQQL